ncbi:MAG: hypothetical protein D6820_16110 [Lentisphaerae bacterium]|nr:MAG: hypothetical protein D6820_16110 [Lentisphaerota bacterium]
MHEKVYRIEWVQDIAVVRFLQVPTADDIHAAIAELATIQPRKRLWILPDSFGELSSDELKRLAIFAKNKFRSPSRMAIVAPSDLSYGQANIYHAYRTDDRSAEHVFRTEAEAIAWLQREEDSD